MKNLLLVAVSLLFFSCNCSKNTSKDIYNQKDNNAQGAQVIVYKTTKDYSNYVPVTMNPDKTKIVSYPAPSDIQPAGKPTALTEGYLLDNRGINENVVFLNFTYDAYSKLSEAPEIEILMKNILDKYPLNELIYCGPSIRFKNKVEDLNALIKGGFQGCTKADIVSGSIKID